MMNPPRTRLSVGVIASTIATATVDSTAVERIDQPHLPVTYRWHEPEGTVKHDTTADMEGIMFLTITNRIVEEQLAPMQFGKKSFRDRAFEKQPFYTRFDKKRRRKK